MTGPDENPGLIYLQSKISLDYGSVSFLLDFYLRMHYNRKTC